MRNQDCLKCAFLIDEQRRLQFVPHFVLPGKMLSFDRPLSISKKVNHVRNTPCQVLKHGDERPSGCESSCPYYYSQIEGLGLNVVYITHYVIRITKHLHNQIEIIEIEIESQGILKIQLVLHYQCCVLIC